MQKKWQRYVLYIITLVILIIIRRIVFDSINNYLQINYTFWFYPWSSIILYYLFNLCFAGLLGFEYIIKERSKAGRWRIDLQKLIIFALPVFILSLGSFLFIVIPIRSIIMKMIKGQGDIIGLLQVIFGYILITCFYKNDSANGS